MQAQLCWIIPLESGARPEHPIAPGGPPLYPSHPIAPGGERPTHPIAPGGPPPGIWGGIGDYIDAGFPAPQPPPAGGPPLEIWGPIGNYPDAGFPAPQPGPGRPTHPIYYPPVLWPPPGPLVGIDNSLPGEPKKMVEWKTAWSPTTGWVVVGVPTVPVPTPADTAV